MIEAVGSNLIVDPIKKSEEGPLSIGKVTSVGADCPISVDKGDKVIYPTVSAQSMGQDKESILHFSNILAKIKKR